MSPSAAFQQLISYLPGGGLGALAGGVGGLMVFDGLPQSRCGILGLEQCALFLGTPHTFTSFLGLAVLAGTVVGVAVQGVVSLWNRGTAGR